MRPLRFTDAERADPFLAPAVAEHDAAQRELADLFKRLTSDYPTATKGDVDAWRTAYDKCHDRLKEARWIAMAKQRTQRRATTADADASAASGSMSTNAAGVGAQQHPTQGDAPRPRASEPGARRRSKR
jgi:hypothetical protein